MLKIGKQKSKEIRIYDKLGNFLGTAKMITTKKIVYWVVLFFKKVYQLPLNLTFLKMA